MKASVYEDSAFDLLTRFRRLKCVHCFSSLADAGCHGGAVPSVITCLICGRETEPRADVPLKEIKVSLQSVLLWLAVLHGNRLGKIEKMLHVV